MRYKNKVEFPCGLKVETSFRVIPILMFIKSKWDSKEYVCPMHGSLCRKYLRE